LALVALAAISNLAKMAKIKLKINFDKTTTELAIQTTQQNSTGIRSELKGWMSHDALQHVCTGHIMTQHA
jgi:hypothetical protein